MDTRQPVPTDQRLAGWCDPGSLGVGAGGRFIPDLRLCDHCHPVGPVRISAAPATRAAGGRAHGFLKLHRPVSNLSPAILRHRPGNVRPTRSGFRDAIPTARLAAANHDLDNLVAPLPVRTTRMAVALTQLRPTAPAQINHSATPPADTRPPIPQHQQPPNHHQKITKFLLDFNQPRCNIFYEKYKTSLFIPHIRYLHSQEMLQNICIIRKLFAFQFRKTISY